MTGRIYLLDKNSQLLPMEEAPYESEKLLQELLATHPDLLAGEQIDSDEPRRWLLISREIAVPGEQDGDRRWSLDHLFLDQDGIPTLVEVKRSSDTRIRREVIGQMLDYAANAVAYWPVEQIDAKFKARCEKEVSDPELELAGFLGDGHDASDFWTQVKTNLEAGRIRLIFIADEIPPELRHIVEFLNVQMDPAEVLAIEIKQFVGEGIKTLVPRVLGQTAATLAKKHPNRRKRWIDWESARANITNPAVLSFFDRELPERESNLDRRILFFRQSNKRRWEVKANNTNAYVWQRGRFPGDVSFWRDKLGPTANVEPVKKDRCLSFSLNTPEDCSAFKKAATETLNSMQWLSDVADDELVNTEASEPTS